MAATMLSPKVSLPVQQPLPDGTPGEWVFIREGWSLQPKTTSLCPICEENHHEPFDGSCLL